VFPVRYELGVYIPEDGILLSHRQENLKSYMALTLWALQRRCNVFRVRYELDLYLPEDGILLSHRLENFIPYTEMRISIEIGLGEMRDSRSRLLEYGRQYTSDRRHGNVREWRNRHRQ
jgi:hypothetical protein